MLSYSINAFVGYRSSSFWGVSVLPGYIQKGSSSESGFAGETTRGRSQLHYINLPILVDLHFFNKFCFSIGPEFGYLLKANGKGDGFNNDISWQYDNKFELAIQGALTYNVWGGFDIGANYSHGLTNISSINYTDNNGDPLGTMKTYNQYGQLFVRFKY
jgi:hypothetical protein